MNSFPLKEKVSKLQKAADTEPIIENENQSSKNLEVSKKSLIFISLGFLSITISLVIALGVIIQKYNQEVKIQENIANFTQEFLQKHQNDPFSSEHTRASKKNHLGVKFPGYTPKNLPAAFAGRKIFPPAMSPQGTK